MVPRSLRFPPEGGEGSAKTAVHGNKRSLPLTSSELNPDNDPDMSKKDANALGEAVDKAVKGDKSKMSAIRRKAFHASPPKIPEGVGEVGARDVAKAEGLKAKARERHPKVLVARRHLP